MPKHRNNYEGAAKATVDLVDHPQTPNEIGDAVLESLIVMAAESQINIWHKATGLSVESLEALYRLYQSGAGYRRARLYAEYEVGVKERRGENNSDS